MLTLKEPPFRSAAERRRQFIAAKGLIESACCTKELFGIELRLKPVMEKFREDSQYNSAEIDFCYYRELQNCIERQNNNLTDIERLENEFNLNFQT